jgi:hypothetical protein
MEKSYVDVSHFSSMVLNAIHDGVVNPFMTAGDVAVMMEHVTCESTPCSPPKECFSAA